MAKKVVLFARVSSDVQDYQRQLADLMPLIKGDGYNEEDMITISHKESATKNDVNNRKSIAELKEVIANNPIEAVYVSEISRLARRNDVLYNVLSLLSEKKICLVIQHPMLIRTIENGRVNPISDVIIAFMSYLAVSESEVKLERQKSGYAQKKKDGKIVSSKVKFGYKRVDGYAVVDSEQARIVNEIFELYTNGTSVTSIWDRYAHTQIFGQGVLNKTAWNKIGNILRDKTYISQNEHFKYPAIVPQELFDKAQAMLDNNKLVKTNLKYVYYSQGIVKLNGHTMTPNASQASYSYRDCEKKKNYGISINVIDSLAWGLAAEAKALMNQTASAERTETIKRQLELTNQKIEGIKNDIEVLSEEQERINKAFVKGRLNESAYDFEYDRIDGEMNYLLNEQEQLNINKTQLEAALAKSDDQNMQASMSYNNIVEITDDLTRQTIIKETIALIDVEFIQRGEYNIRVIYTDASLNNDTYYKYKQSGAKINLYCLYGDYVEDWSGTWENRIQTLWKRNKLKKEARN